MYPTRDIIPVEIDPLLIDGSIPMVDDIGWEVRRLRRHRSMRASVMRAEHIQAWLAEANREERPDMEKWEKVVDVLQYDFREGSITMECACQMVGLDTKGNRELHWIRLVEVICKALSIVVYC